MTDQQRPAPKYGEGPRIVLRKGDRTYQCPANFAETWINPNVFRFVVCLMQYPDVASLGTLRENIRYKLSEAKVENHGWQLDLTLGWLCEQDLIIVKFAPIGTAGIISLFVKLADGVEVVSVDQPH